MNQGGTAARHAGLGVIGWVFGAAQILLYGACLPIGLKQNDEVRASWRRWLLVFTLIYLLTFTALIVSYFNQAEPPPGVLLGLPTSTVLFVFGMWIAPAVFVVLYSINYRRWVYDEDDAQRFAELIAKYKTEQNHR